MTPAIKVLEKNKCKFKILKYEHDPLNTNFGEEAALKLNLNPLQVYKTLLVELSPKQLVVCVIPVANQLNLKEVANIFKSKKAVMANKDEAMRSTGYLLGGISALGQKKRLKTILDKSVEKFEVIYISGGKRGLDIEVCPKDLQKLLNAITHKVTL